MYRDVRVFLLRAAARLGERGYWAWMLMRLLVVICVAGLFAIVSAQLRWLR